MSLSSLPLYASSDIDVTVYDFLRDNSGATANDLKDIEVEVEEAMAELKTKASSDELAEDKGKLKRLESEAALAKYLQKDLRVKLSYRQDLEKKMIATQWDPKDEDQGNVNINASRSLEIDPKIPFKLLQTREIINHENNDKSTLYVRSKLVLDKSMSREKWPTLIRRQFEDMSDDEIENFLDTHINSDLGKEVYNVMDVSDNPTEKEKSDLEQAFKDLSKNLSAQVSSKIFGRDSASVLNVATNKRLEDLGDKNKELSEIWKLSRQIERDNDPKARKYELEDLRAKLKIAEALRADPKLAKLAEEEDACAVMLKVLKKEGIKRLSPESRMECEAHLEEKIVAKDDKNIEEDFDDSSREEDMNNAAKFSDWFEGQRARCVQLKQEAAVRQKQVEDQIAPLFMALKAVDAQTFKCEMLGALAGDLLATSNNDPLLAEMSKDNQFLQMGTTNPEEIAEKAQRVASSSADSLKGLQKLEDQKKCVDASLGLAGATLSAMQTYGQQWRAQNPTDYKKKIEEALKIQSMSQALSTAIGDELSARNAGGSGKVKAMSSSGDVGAAGQVRALGSSVGTGAPIRLRKTSDTRTERGLSSGTNNGAQRNMSTGAGAPGGVPRPNFLGE